jgi:hypothetical protein
MLTALVAIAVGIGFALLAGRKGRSSRRRYSRVSTSSDLLFPIDPGATDNSHHGHHHHHDGGGHHDSFDGGFDGGGHH